MQKAGPTNVGERREKRPREGIWTKVGGAAGALGVLVTVFFGIRECSPDDSSPQAATQPAPTSSAVSHSVTPTRGPLAQGHQRLANVEGIDLDTARVQDQNEPGIDVSPSKTADQLNAMSNGTPRFAVADHAGTAADVRDRCHDMPPGSWTKTLPNLYARHLGDKVCVRTDQSNLSALTLTHIPSAAEQYVEFDYITWQDR